ncbi:LANO_0D03268g1_1 [Lachancea nothofagi CBS 11611]|uniref:LANO_0D03268g1_1 n=1 Tax=Lachancea nothofagi CBS 11611 TaxID=1266666 RepID=A0A1G4JF36_9SACH|nr:LANO_0D03268g1_1 [Lachancea nothofagi CBS 11611]
MDASTLSEFQLLFPLAQRCILLIFVGLWLWVWQLTIFYKGFHVDISQLVPSSDPSEFVPRSSAKKQLEATRATVIQITKIILPWHIATCFLLQQCNSDQTYAPDAWLVCLLNVQPVCQFITIFAVIFTNSPMVSRCFRNILCFGNIEPRPLRNNYIIITDSLTSYAKPLIDFGLYMCHLLLDPLSEKCIASRSSLGIAINLDLMIGISPVMLRLLQCLREWKRSRSAEEAKSALFNAIKYSLNFPILMCTVYSRTYPTEKPAKYVYWFMLMNSTYGFWWDLTMDWNLGMFNFSFAGMDRNESLRSRRIFPKPAYYLAICIDFALRFVWLWEAMSGRSVFEGEINIFFLQALELFRRWVWLFIKLESEAVNAEVPDKVQD